MRQKTPYGNITPKMAELAARSLLSDPKHPLGILRKKIEEFFIAERFYKGPLQDKRKVKYGMGHEFSPVVTTKQNFDELLIPKGHPSRKRSDTYYISEDLLLRTHATAHEKQLFEAGHEAFIIFGKMDLRSFQNKKK